MNDLMDLKQHPVINTLC